MFILKSRIEFTPREGDTTRPNKKSTFHAVTSVRIHSSVDKLTDTCEIELPRGLEVEGRQLIPESTGERSVSTGIKIEEGDKVKVFLGYDHIEFEPRFEGFVKRVHPTRPVLIECEDFMYKLKEPTIEALSFGEDAPDGPGTLVNIVQTLQQHNEFLRDADIEVIDGELMANYRIENLSPAGILKDMRDNIYTACFFQNGKLYVGRNFWQEYREENIFDFNFNIIEDNLEYRTEDDLVLQIEGRRWFINEETGEWEENTVTVGNEGGIVRTKNFPIRTDPEGSNTEELEALTTKVLNEMSFDGYQGSFTTFGQPRVKHGDIIRLQDKRYPDKVGRYFVREVTTEFGDGGFRQDVELDLKVDGVSDVEMEKNTVSI